MQDKNKKPLPAAAAKLLSDVKDKIKDLMDMDEHAEVKVKLKRPAPRVFKVLKGKTK